MDVVIFAMDCALAAGILALCYPLGRLVARLVTLKQLERMAEKPPGIWARISVFLLALMAAIAASLAVGIYLGSVKHYSSNIVSTASMVVLGALFGILLGTEVTVRERVNFVREDLRGLLAWW